MLVLIYAACEEEKAAFIFSDLILKAYIAYQPKDKTNKNISHGLMSSNRKNSVRY